MQEETDIQQLQQKLGARNYAQLALIDKRMLLEGQTSEQLYQQKDFYFHRISQGRGIGIRAASTPFELKFTEFSQLNDYLESSWNLEIVGPVESGKSRILRDCAQTMVKLGYRVVYLSYIKEFSSQEFEVIMVKQIQQLFLFFGMILENPRQLNYQIIFIDKLSSLLYLSGSYQEVEHFVTELHIFLNKLQSLGVMVVVTSISKSKDFSGDGDQVQQKDYLSQKQILSPPWNMIWQAQISINKQLDLKQGAVTQRSKVRYINLYRMTVKQPLKLEK